MRFRDLVGNVRQDFFRRNRSILVRVAAKFSLIRLEIVVRVYVICFTTALDGPATATAGIGAAADSAGTVAMASGSLMNMCVVWRPNEEVVVKA